MKTLSALALGVLFLFSVAPRVDAAAQFGRQRPDNNRDRVCVYQDIHFQGWEQCYTAGDEVSDLRQHNNNISSIRVYGRAQVLVFEDTGFRGQAAVFTADVADLGLRSLGGGSKSWSDRIESLRVTSDFDSPRNARDREEPRNGICVYERENFEGRSECWTAGEEISDLARRGNWSDHIASIRIFGNSVAIAYRDIGFRGERLTIDRDYPNLDRIRGNFGNWKDQISSIEIAADRGRFNRGRR